jgi:hypothetical protein
MNPYDQAGIMLAGLFIILCFLMLCHVSGII